MKRFRLIEEPGTQFDKAKQPDEWEADRVDYVSCVKQLARRPINPQAGADFEEMEKALRILKALDGLKLGDLLALEDADMDNLTQRARVFRWGVVDERLVRFTKTIIDAQEWPVDATEKERGIQPDKEPEDAAAARLDGHRKPVRA